MLQVLTTLDKKKKKQTLGSFKYVKSQVVVHTDERVMPKDKSSWRGIVFVTDGEREMTMATMYMNASMTELKGKQNIFQTWHPITRPKVSFSFFFDRKNTKTQKHKIKNTK